MSNKVNVTIDGKAYQFDAGTTILDAAKSLGVEIPTLCHNDKISHYASCWVCTVELKSGRGGMVPSCSTKLENGMVAELENKRVKESRKASLDLLLSDHFGDCYAPCNQKGCPANIDIQGFLFLEARGLYKEAANLIREKAPFPNVLGRVCPRPCEEVCRRQKVDKSVLIGIQKRYIAEMERKEGGPFLPKLPQKSSDKKVTIIGAGPAGLSAAYYLRLQGHEVTIYERHPKHGGMLRYGIPYYRLPEDVMDLEGDAIINQLGVTIHYNTEVGKSIGFEEIVQNSDAVLLAVGASKATPMGVEGEDLPGVFSGIDLLEKLAKYEPVDIGKRVVVAGGGSTAMDAARASVRLGAKATVVYRRTKNEMPAHHAEVRDAYDEGVDIKVLTNPVKIEKTKQGLKITCIKMELSEPDESGRRRPIAIDGSEFEIEADSIIMAIGQKTDFSFIKNKGVNKWGLFDTKGKTYQTVTDPKIFVAGDCYKGPDLAVRAVADARKAAQSINQFLKGEEVVGEEVRFSSYPGDLDTLPPEMFEAFTPRTRKEIDLLPVNKRAGNFDEVEQSFTKSEMTDEAKRCLECGCNVVDICLLKKHSQAYRADQNLYAGARRTYKTDYSHEKIKMETHKCINCSACVRACIEVKKCHILGNTGRGFSSRITPMINVPLGKTHCDGCEECVNVCPTAGVRINRDIYLTNSHG